MNDQIYSLDRDALLRAVHKRGWDARMLSRFSGVHINTVRRLLGEWYPERMPVARRDKIKGFITIKLAFALRVKPQVIAPDLPKKPPRENPPEPPPLNPKRSELAKWRSREQMADVRQRRWEITAPDAELEATLDED